MYGMREKHQVKDQIQMDKISTGMWEQKRRLEQKQNMRKKGRKEQTDLRNICFTQPDQAGICYSISL